MYKRLVDDINMVLKKRRDPTERSLETHADEQIMTDLGTEDGK